MKKISIIFLIAVLCLSSSAQKVIKTSAKLTGIDKIALEFQFADSILIQKWDKNELYVKAVVNINDNKDNDNFVFNTEKISNKLKIESQIKNLEKLGHHKKVKDMKTGEIIEINSHVEMNLFFEVYVPENINVSLETISGDIKTMGLGGKQTLNTISGDIDYYLSENAKNNIELSTISGEMFTDFDFRINKDGYHHYGNQNFTHKLNGGGNTIELETISGNIYLRKNK